MDRPRVGGIQRVEWCTRQPTRIALKTWSFSWITYIYTYIWIFLFSAFCQNQKIIENFLKYGLF